MKMWHRWLSIFSKRSSQPSSVTAELGGGWSLYKWREARRDISSEMTIEEVLAVLVKHGASREEAYEFLTDLRHGPSKEASLSKDDRTGTPWSNGRPNITIREQEPGEIGRGGYVRDAAGNAIEIVLKN